MNINKGNIGNALHSVAPDHVVATADDIYDETLNKYQSELNQQIGQGGYNPPQGGIPKTDLASDVQASLGKADNAVPNTRKVNGKALSSDITLNAGDIGALPSSTSIPTSLSQLNDDSTHRTVTDSEKTNWNDKYTKTEVDNMISSAPESDVIVVEVPSGSDIATYLLNNVPAAQRPNNIFRVPGTNSFSEWAWNGTAFIQLDEKDYGIDDEPIYDSTNLVKSGALHRLFREGYKPKVFQGIWGGGTGSATVYVPTFSNRVCLEILPANNISITLNNGYVFRQILKVDANLTIVEVIASAQDNLTAFKGNYNGYIAATICKSDATANILPSESIIKDIDYYTEKANIPSLYQGYWANQGNKTDLVLGNNTRVAMSVVPSNVEVKTKEGFQLRQVLRIDKDMKILSSDGELISKFRSIEKGYYLAITFCKSNVSETISPDDDIIDSIKIINPKQYSGSLEEQLNSNRTIITGSTIGSTCSLEKITNTGWCCGVIDAVQGDIFFICGTGGNNARLYAFLDSSNKVLEVFGNDSAVSVTNVIKIVAPANTAKLVVNMQGDGILANYMYNQAWTFKKGINLLQGAATDKYIDTIYLNRVTCNNKLASPFILKTKSGYVIRAIAEYDAATGTFLRYSAGQSETRTQWHQQFEETNRFYVPTFTKTDSTQAITPNEGIIDFVDFETRFEFLPKEKAFKNAVFMGDSITHGVYSYWSNGVKGDANRFNGFDLNANFAAQTNKQIIATATAYPGIPYFFGLLARCETVNLARRGSGFVQDGRDGGNFLDLIEGNQNKTLGGITAYDFSGIDLVMVSLGINDYIQHITIGDIAAFKSSGVPVRGTVIGNLAIGIKAILEQNPLCKIVICSPYNSFGQVSKGGDYAPDPSIYYGNESTNYALGYDQGGGTLQDYIDAIDEVCKYYGIQHIPLSMSNVCNRITLKNIMIDGLHPSKDSYIKLAAEIYGKCNFGE